MMIHSSASVSNTATELNIKSIEKIGNESNEIVSSSSENSSQCNPLPFNSAISLNKGDLIDIRDPAGVHEWRLATIKRVRKQSDGSLRVQVRIYYYYHGHPHPQNYTFTIKSLWYFNKHFAKPLSQSIFHQKECRHQGRWYRPKYQHCQYCRTKICQHCQPYGIHNELCSIKRDEKRMYRAIRNSNFVIKDEAIIRIIASYSIGFIINCIKCNKKIRINNEYEMEQKVNFKYYELNLPQYSTEVVRFSANKEQITKIYGKYRVFFCANHKTRICVEGPCVNAIPIQSPKAYSQICGDHGICCSCNALIDYASYHNTIHLCKHCGLLFCVKCKIDRECKLCIKSMEISNIKQPLLSVTNSENLLNNHFEENIIGIIIEYSIGVATTCVLCNDYIKINNKFDFMKDIDFNNNEIYKYKLQDLRSVEDDEIRILYNEIYRIFCSKCFDYGTNPRSKLWGCYDSNCWIKDIRLTNNNDTFFLCGKHQRCVECGANKRCGEEVKLCKCCDKYRCRKCAGWDFENCRHCKDKQLIENKRKELSGILLEIFDDGKIIDILAGYAVGYLLICHAQFCNNEIIINSAKVMSDAGFFGIHEVAGRKHIGNPAFVFGKYIKVYCEQCVELYGTDRWCELCGEFVVGYTCKYCGRYDNNDALKYELSGECENDESDTDLLNEIDYLKHLRRYDNDAYYQKKVRYYSLN